jgi:hypothetical protein
MKYGKNNKNCITNNRKVVLKLKKFINFIIKFRIIRINLGYKKNRYFF